MENKSYNVYLCAVCYTHKMVILFQPTTKEIDAMGLKKFSKVIWLSESELILPYQVSLPVTT